MNFLEFIYNKTEQCGWQIAEVISDSMVKLTFAADLGDENVYIRPCGKNADGNTIIEFTSNGIPVPEDYADSGIIALYLLQRNGEMLFGHWGIETFDDQKYFTVFATLIANTMDNDEFTGAVRAVVSERVNIRKSIQKNSIDF